MLTLALTIAVVLAAIAGLGVAVWSFIDTRRRYYDEYIGQRHDSQHPLS